MKPLIVVLLTILSVCEAQQFKFCTPPQWEGYQGTLAGINNNGTPTIVQSLDWVSYDLNNTKIAVFTSGTTDGVPFKINYIYDYPKKTLFSIEGKTCKKTPLTDSFKELCIPKGYTITWVKSRLGLPLPYGELLGVIGFKGHLNKLSYYVTLNISPRVPVLEHLIGQINGTEVFQNTGFMNITMGIRDPSVFVPPLSCSNVTRQEEGNDIPSRRGIMAL